jgi:hypothetical protein
MSKCSVAKGRKFRPQNKKGADKYGVGPTKSGAEFGRFFKKGPKKGRTFLKFG